MNTLSIPCVDQSALGRRGIFYAGGRYSGVPGRTHVCNQMFVEVYLPREVKHPYPLIMFHGAGQTNVNWLTTPDGRMGWADYFVAQGYEVCLAEQPSRGRSAYHPEDNGARTYHSVETLQKRFMSDAGDWPQAKLHTQWPGHGDDETNRQFFRSQVEYLDTNKASQELVLAAGQDLLQKTGPAILLTHSQAGPFGWLLADTYPHLVTGIVALEPSGPPFSADLSSDIPKNYGIADLPLHFVPAVSAPEEIALELLKAPTLGMNDGWIMKEPARKLPRLTGIPILLMVSEASYHAGYDHLTSRVLEQAGVPHDFVRLEEIGIRGNGHMMMLEKNNLDICAWIAHWLKKHEKLIKEEKR